MKAFDLRAEVKQIISTLEQNGYEAFAVGGCVRDSLMGKVPLDWDICTSALPEQIIRCFDGFHIIETGLKHGTVTIMLDHEPYEVTTFRIDGEYSDNRHPDSVEFVTKLKSDLSRRDFTINAMAYSPKTGVIDFYNGKEDLKQGLIRCVGNPILRFNEDALRIMRALRFASVLGFEIEEATADSIGHCKELLKSISEERINSELCKLLLGKGAEAVLTEYADIISAVIPEIKPMIGFEQNSPYHNLDVWTHTVRTVANAPEDIVIKLAMLFHDIGKPYCYTQDGQGIGHFYGHAPHSADIAFDIMKRLKFENETLHCVKALIYYHDVDLLSQNKLIKRWLNKLGEEKLRQLIQVKCADTMGQTDGIKADRLPKLAEIEHCVDDIIEQRQCFCLRDLAVNGSDLIDIGIHEGIAIGKALQGLLNLVLDEQVANDKEKLLQAAKNIIANMD